MRLLLDTHVWIWSQESPESLGDAARELLAEKDTEVFISPVSSLEVARLEWAGRLSMAGRTKTWVENAMQALLAETAALTHEICVESYELPGEFHRDPVDRMLVATARVLDLTFLTADERILSYPHALTLNARQ